MKILTNTSLKPYHTFGLELNANEIIKAQKSDDFLQIWKQRPDEPKLVVGEGSNLLFCEDFAGVIVLNCLKGIEVQETTNEWLLHVAGGENWHELVTNTVDRGMPGLENLALIPGLVGSAPIQNIGAYGVEFKSNCDYVDVLMLDSGEITRLTAQECEFGYRDSVFKHGLKDKAIVTAVGFKLPKCWKPVVGYGALSELGERDDLTAKDVYNKVCEMRCAKLPDPKEIGNAGSFFKNPVVAKSLADRLLLTHPTMPHFGVSDAEVKLAAGWLIDQCGLKGSCVGGAAVHSQQALVLTNTGKATAKDVLKLAKNVVETVYDRFGVTLEHEVRFMGRTAETNLEAICLP
ncbi:UDP-N-acetylenolpyruvoylglucosamine reductase [Enterovibrio norvegicus FF-454]|uniref:UDP-N-acetylenolpyruvoylglucosamine reductase n=1 Tax=Enterovibrio norvegicus FF-454 TaxID=1185651 RepID=A0A1E5CCU4_9GAMM|nr:UDP-N-acetylmuramate dehydrogenase [Enterovibrio norvegicus]OEE63257.1 UDP-N-acetylenolpyruvoylglucosamine reductase [Enterovibrio norvegicus FF-454]